VNRGRFSAIGVLVAAPVACGPDTVSMGFDSPVENVGTMPNGPVRACWGRGCPYGECDDDEMFSDVDCDDAFPGPVDDDALFCQPGDENGYCVEVGPDVFTTDYWVVDCHGDTAVAERCGRGCSYESPGGASCL
jgi:hypothetical protein